MAIGRSRRHKLSVALALLTLSGISFTYLRSPVIHGVAEPRIQRLTLESAQFESVDVGWLLLRDAVTGARELVTTSNAGKSWHRVALPVNASTDVLGFRLIDGSYATLQLGHGLRTTDDGGATWRKVELPDGAKPGTGVYSTDRLHGWYLSASRADGVARPAAMWTTQDGGASWLPLFSATSADMAKHGVPLDGDKLLLGFATPDDGWLDIVSLGSSRLLATHDGGMNWTPVQLPVEAPVVAMRAFAPGEVLLLQASPPGYLVTTSTDSGVTWSGPRQVPVTGVDLAVPTRPVFIDLNAWVLPAGRQIEATHDRGQTWSTFEPQLPAGLQLDYMPLVAPSGKGFAVARDDLENPYLLATADSGQHWALVSVPQLA